MPNDKRIPASQIKRILRVTLFYAAPLGCLVPALNAAEPAGPLVLTGFHLTARPWQPLDTPNGKYLDVIEGLCRFTVRHQNAGGAVIDPFLNREHQYATPYFAAAVAALAADGRAADLVEAGARAMDHATACFNGGRDAIPDQHGEFFVPALTFALELFHGRVAEPRWQSWRERLARPLGEILGGGTNNWRTYPMKGEWMRAAAGLVARDQAVAFIEKSWTETQRARIAPAPWRLYHDRTSDPDTLSVEAVGRGNLLALTELGYDGPSAPEIREAAEAG